MSQASKQESKIIDLFNPESASEPTLREEDIKNFAKSLLIFRGNSDNCSSTTRLCQVASLDDFKTSHTLRVKDKKPPKSGLLIKLSSSD
ncbi:hypothetical protein SAMN06296036_109109 [Pseudobacteriovorax antillogorgiicola]|uniref:Uncharacterized protein n=1 Tax=Pseudobacteriovorax antillogorgiicola TaxID=1513793 RepID=A0A1Y6C003_9BACT|nr:hypothetical protein EDD56_109104 [Pseudobacteriovorax antillogorgiicola]SMF29475.1 hypothetical protein SAMN06296036_109109 [Pseudobacteriovorax antillogorgiicola]